MSTIHFDHRPTEAVSVRESLDGDDLRHVFPGLLADTTGDPAIGAYRPAIEIYAVDLDRSWA